MASRIDRGGMSLHGATSADLEKPPGSAVYVVQNLGIITPMLNAYGGSEIYLLECLARWQRRVPHITLYTPTIDFDLLCEYGIDSSRVEVSLLPTLPTTKHTHRYGLIHDLLLQPRVWEERIEHHDVVFQYLFPTHLVRCGASVWFAAEPFRAAYDLREYAGPGSDENLEVHVYPKLHYETVATSEHDVFLSLIEQFESHATFDALATNSISTGRYLETVYGKTPDRVVYPGIRTWPESHEPTFEQPRVLSVGRLWHHKQVHLQIEAMRHVPEGELVIVGTGPDEQNLRQLTARLGLEARVCFEGAVSNERLTELWKSSSCCVYTPHLEPFGMVPLEAAAAGLPVVGTRGGGFAEILDDSCAILVDAAPDRIGGAIRTLLEDRELAARMGARGRARAEEHTWDRTADELYELLDETARSQAPRSVRRDDVIDVVPRLGAHYYPWYRTGDVVEHWNENREFAAVSDPPVDGPYSSSDDATLQRHLREARRAKLDFFVVNWQVGSRGLNPTELQATRRLFDLVENEDHPIQLSVMLSLATDDPTRLFEAIGTLHDEFVPRRAYQRVDDEPLAWYFTSTHFLNVFWRHAADLRAAHADARLIAAGPIPYSRYLPHALRDFFSGWTFYSPLEVGTARIRESLWRNSYDGFLDDRDMDSPRRLRTFSICPGYDDRHLQSESRRRTGHVPRHGTRTFEEMQDVALSFKRPPDLVVVTSFNEFHENTHIEPSEAHGDRYLESLAAFHPRLEAAARKQSEAPPRTAEPISADNRAAKILARKNASFPPLRNRI